MEDSEDTNLLSMVFYFIFFTTLRLKKSKKVHWKSNFCSIVYTKCLYFLQVYTRLQPVGGLLENTEKPDKRAKIIIIGQN